MFVIMLIYSKEDEQFVAELYLELRDDMLHVANNILHNYDDAEDAVQTAFANIIKHLQRIQELQEKSSKYGRKSAAYCIVIVKNISRRLYNKKKSQNTIVFDEMNYETKSNNNTEERALLDHEMSNLDEVVSKLPQDLSKPFVMRYYKGMKYKEISTLLGISANAAQKRVERATDIIIAKMGEGLMV